MTLKLGLINKAHKSFLKAQKLYRHVKTPEFADRLKRANPQQLEQIKNAVESGNLEALKFIEADLLPLRQVHIRKLRLKARALHISFWYNMSKDELIKAINEIKNDENSDPTVRDS